MIPIVELVVHPGSFEVIGEQPGGPQREMCGSVGIAVAESACEPVARPIRDLVLPEPMGVLCDVQSDRQPADARDLDRRLTIRTENSADLPKHERGVF